MSKEAYYFSHDANARNDEKVLMLRADHGWEGYGVYWALLEMMFENADTKLSHNKIKGIALSYNINITVLNDVINTCITEGLFVSDEEKFWSESLLRRKGKYQELKEKKSAAGKKGMEKRWANKKNDNTVITDDNTDITENNKGKEMKLNKLNKTKEDIKELKKPKKQIPKIKFAEFVSMTEDEHKKLVVEHGIEKVDEMIKVLDNYKGASGKTYKSDYRAILQWVVERVKTKPGTKQNAQSVFDKYKNMEG